MPLRPFCCLSVTVIVYGRLPNAATAPNHTPDATFLVGLDSGEALRYFGPPAMAHHPPSRWRIVLANRKCVCEPKRPTLTRLPPSAREARTQHNAAHPLYKRWKTLTQLHCQVRIHSDAPSSHPSIHTALPSALKPITGLQAALALALPNECLNFAQTTHLS